MRVRTLMLALGLTLPGCVDDLAFDHPCDPLNAGDAPDGACMRVIDADLDPNCPDGGVDGEICFAPGRFTIEDGARSVELSYSYIIGHTEVTRGAWQTVMQASLDDEGSCLADDCPVTGVSWNQAVEFCNRLTVSRFAEQVQAGEIDVCYERRECDGCGWRPLPPHECSGYRLPTEAEWAYVANRAWSLVGGRLAGIAHFGDGLDVVGERGGAPDRVYDLFGNAEEMTHDTAVEDLGTLDDCLANPHGNTRGDEGANTERAARGGAIDDGGEDMLLTKRVFFNPEERDPLRGLRIARTIDVSPRPVCR